MKIRFKSQRQRKKVMALLRERGFKQKPIAVGTEGKYIRARIIQPSKFQKGSFRTIPAGKDNKKGSKLVIARPIGKRTTKIQAILLPKR